MSRILLVCCLFFFGFPLVNAQLTQDETFGKNRVQYHKDFKYWWQYETQNFVTYWYSPARKVAESAILYAEKDYREIQDLLEHHINDKIQIIVFKDLTDFKQSNLGTEEVFEIQEGQTKIHGNRVFIYSTGDHSELRHQIREGIASVHIAQMLQGNTIQEIVHNAFLASLPEWYITGLISYIGAPYDYEFENKVRAYFAENEATNFESFADKHPTLAGHALWNYIYARYGGTKLSNLLYITRINRRLDDGFIYVLGVTFDRVVNDCFLFLKRTYEEQTKYFVDPELQEIPIKKKKISKRRRKKFNLIVTDVQLSPDGKQLMYVTNELGKYRVWLYDMKTGDQKKLMGGSFRNPFQQADYEYPSFTWGRRSGQLYGVYEKRDKLYLKEWDLRNGETRTQHFPPDIQRVYSVADFGRDSLLLSASTDGYTDLYIYRPNTRQYKRLTNDYFDDRSAKPVTIGQSKYIVFSSNRLNTSLETQELDTLLPEEEFDLYLLSPKSNFMQRLTDTKWASERQLVVDGSTVYYISDENGIRNRWKLDIAADELNPVMLTEYETGIDDFTEIPGIGVESIHNNYDARLRIYNPDDKEVREIHYTVLANLRRRVEGADVEQEKNIEKKEETPIILQKPEPKQEENYYFQSRFDKQIPLPKDFYQQEKDEDESLLILPDFSQHLSGSDRQNNIKPFNSARMLAYRLAFGLTDFDIDVNNDVLFTGLNSFTGYKRGFEYPEMGILVRAESRDLFENYIVSGGFRVPFQFNGTEFYLAIEDRKFQLDKKLSLFRQSMKERRDERYEDEPDTRSTTHMAVLELKYPLSIFSSLRLMTSVRLDRTIFLPSEPTELGRDDINQQRIGMRLEYVFDNSYETRPNIRNGMRAKVYIEGVNRFQLQFDPWEFDLSQAFMTVIGADIRNYFRLDRYSIFATRLAGATSFGSEKILYYMGGVRNWISPKYNESIPFPSSNDFAYQGAAMEMRGFRQNIRNGATYVLGNAELRVPLFNYFTKNEIQSRFFRNFQIIGFFDAGTAWHGSSPSSEDNPLNTEFIQNSTSQVKVTYYRDPLVMGYGMGARIHLLGYFLRFDYAWGYESRKQTDPIFYFSLGYDF